MEKIELDGEIYYYINNSFVDSTFCRVPDEIQKKLSEIHFKKFDYKQYKKEELLSFLKALKESGQHIKAKEVGEFILDQYHDDQNLVKLVLPILTSVLRSLHQSALAISIAQKYTDLYKCDSSALWTSVSAAFCDVGEFSQALEFLKLAIKKQRKTREVSFEQKSLLQRIAQNLKLDEKEVRAFLSLKDDEDSAF